MAEHVNGMSYPAPPGAAAVLNEVVDHLNLHDLLLERGTSGLKRAGGYVRDEPLQDLIGWAGLAKYREMKDQSSVIGACLTAIDARIRKVEWQCTPADASEEAAKYADLVSGMLFDDLDMSWDLQISETLSFLWAGFNFQEIVLKRRLGDDPPRNRDGSKPLPSKFNDGLIGFGRIATRGQETVLRWEFDQAGALLGMHQIDPWMGRQAYIPYEKAVLFRPMSYKSNPEGRSVLRSAYRAYYMVTHIENTEAIGIERDLTGLPTFGVPPQWWSGSATPEDMAQLEAIKGIGRNIRNDSQSCLVYPLIYDQNGNQLFRFDLASSSGTKAINTDPIIQRYELRIAQALLSDLLFLGHENTGSFALADTKATTETLSLGGYMKVIQDEYNRRAIPMIWKVNAFPKALMPQLTHGDIEPVDLGDLARFILSFGRVFHLSGVDENHIRGLAGWPIRPDAETNELPPSIQPAGAGGQGQPGTTGIGGSHGGGSGLESGTGTDVEGTGPPDLDRDMYPPSLSLT